MIPLTIIIITFFPILIGLNFAIHFLIIKKTVRKYVIPRLQNKGVQYSGYEALGLLNSGDFKGKEKKQLSLFVNMNGSSVIDIYFYAFYQEGKQKKRVTVKVETIACVIRKVKYSDEL